MNLEFNQKIQKIKETINIVDVIGKYLKLNHKGTNFWAICPFHEDSNPSLSISQEKQIYKCFSCGEQGDVFMFLQKYKNIDFFLALTEIAEITNIDLKKFDLEINEIKKNELHKFKILNNLALNFYQYQLITEEGKQALQYLKQRNINEKSINDFMIGYAPSDNQLLDYLKLQSYQEIDIIESGLAKITDKDTIKDMFFNRIIFPIIDLEGNCLGFSARKYFDLKKDNFKYINTPETEIFKKRQILYNLYNAKKAINIKNDNIYLVEGYMDVIALSNQNINNCVALMGTNLTKEQINILRKITKNIIIFLDGDDAGKLAAFKIAINLLENDFNVKVINNSTNLDPDELVNKQINHFNEILKNTLHPLEFAINFFLEKYDIKKDSFQLKEFLFHLKPIWNVIKDPVTINFYLENLQKITNLSKEELLSVFQLQQRKQSGQNSNFTKFSNKKLNKISLQDKLLEVQKQLFFLLLISRDVYIFLEKEKFIFYNKQLMNLYFLIAEQYQENEKLTEINLEEIQEMLKDNEILEFLQVIIKQYKNKNYQINQYLLQDYLKIINNYLIEVEIENLHQQINKSKELEIKIELLKQMSILKNKLNE